MRRLAAAALLAAAVLAACGGGAPKAQTKAGYVARADGVCADLRERFAAAGATDPQTPQQIKRSVDVLADLYGDLRRRLEDIPLPTAAADRRGAAAYLADVRRTDAQLARVRGAVRRFVDAAGGDRQQAAQAGIAVRRELDAFRAAQTQAGRSALEYGFDVCGNLG